MPKILSRNSLYRRQNSSRSSSRTSFGDGSILNQLMAAASLESKNSKQMLGSWKTLDQESSSGFEKDVGSFYAVGYHPLSSHHFPTSSLKRKNDRNFSSNPENHQLVPPPAGRVLRRKPSGSAFLPNSLDEPIDDEWGHFIDVVEAEQRVVRSSKILSARNINNAALVAMCQQP